MASERMRRRARASSAGMDAMLVRSASIAVSASETSAAVAPESVRSMSASGSGTNA